MEALWDVIAAWRVRQIMVSEAIFWRTGGGRERGEAFEDEGAEGARDEDHALG